MDIVASSVVAASQILSPPQTDTHLAPAAASDSKEESAKPFISCHEGKRASCKHFAKGKRPMRVIALLMFMLTLSFLIYVIQKGVHLIELVGDNENLLEMIETQLLHRQVCPAEH